MRLLNTGCQPTDEGIAPELQKVCRKTVWRGFLAVIMTVCAAMPGATTAAAADFPKQKPLSLVVPYPAGGASDASARLFASLISRDLSQQVIVENVGGGTGMLGVRRVLHNAPDGYTFLHGSPNEVILSPLLNAAATYVPEDMRLVQPITEATVVLLAKSELPVNTLDEFIALARAPGAKALTYGTVGIGSLYNIMGDYLGKRVGATFVHVPYRGAAPAMQDLIGKQIDFAILPYQSAMDGMSKNGQLKIITTFSKTLPGPLNHLPKISDSKIVPDFEYTIAGGYYVRKDAPAVAMQTLRVAIGHALADPELRERQENEGKNVLHAMSEQESDAYFAQQVARYREMVRALNLQPM